jgi:hypothetical protein
VSTEQDWSAYARVLRQVAGARAQAQQAQDRLTANRTQAQATARAEAEAVRERGRRLEQRLTELADEATGSLRKAGLSREGRRVAIALPPVRGLADIETAALQLTKQLDETVARLEQVRAEARAERDRRRRRALDAALVLIGFAATWALRGSLPAGLVAAGIVVLTLLAAHRLSGSARIGWAAAVLVVIVMAAGLPWWLAIPVPVVVAGASIVLPKKRN